MLYIVLYMIYGIYGRFINQDSTLPDFPVRDHLLPKQWWLEIRQTSLDMSRYIPDLARMPIGLTFSLK